MDPSSRRRTSAPDPEQEVDRTDEPAAIAPGPEAILRLQRSAGNAAVSRLVGAPALARKATQGLPGWGDPLVGDDDSEVTFKPVATFTPTELVGGTGDRSRMREMLDAFTQRRMDRSELPDRGGYEGTLRIKAGTKGVLTIRMNAHFLLDQKWNDEYDQEFSCSWDVAIDEQGKLTISKGRKDIVPPNDNEAEFSLTALDLEEDPTAGTVGMTPVFQSYQNTDIPNISVGGEVGIGKGGAVGGQATLGNERTYPAGALAKNFLIRIQPTDIKVPEPKVEIGPITMQTHRTHDVLFEKPKQSNVSGKQENELYRWYTTLSPETRAMLRAGEGKVKLDGYASTTDKARNNRELARDRVESVKRILRDFGAKEFDDAAFGEYEEGVGEPEGEVEAQEKRKVAIEVVEAPVTIYEGDAAAGAP